MNFSEKQYSALPNFSGDLLPSQKSSFSAVYFFRRGTFSQLHFLSTATFPIYQLFSVLSANYALLKCVSCVSVIPQSRILGKVEYVAFSKSLLFKIPYCTTLLIKYHEQIFHQICFLGLM